MGRDTDARPSFERSRINPYCAVADWRHAALANFRNSPVSDIEFFMSSQSKFV